MAHEPICPNCGATTVRSAKGCKAECPNPNCRNKGVIVNKRIKSLTKREQVLFDVLKNGYPKTLDWLAEKLWEDEKTEASAPVPKSTVTSILKSLALKLGHTQWQLVQDQRGIGAGKKAVYRLKYQRYQS